MRILWVSMLVGVVVGGWGCAKEFTQPERQPIPAIVEVLEWQNGPTKLYPGSFILVKLPSHPPVCYVLYRESEGGATVFPWQVPCPGAEPETSSLPEKD